MATLLELMGGLAHPPATPESQPAAEAEEEFGQHSKAQAGSSIADAMGCEITIRVAGKTVAFASRE